MLCSTLLISFQLPTTRAWIPDERLRLRCFRQWRLWWAASHRPQQDTPLGTHPHVAQCVLLGGEYIICILAAILTLLTSSQGLISLVIAGCSWFLIPRGPETAKFLTEEERTTAVNRLLVDCAGTAELGKTSLKHIWQALSSPHVLGCAFGFYLTK